MTTSTTLPTYQEVLEEQRDRAAAYGRLFLTRDGEKVLEDLEDSFLHQRTIRPAEGAAIDPLQLALNHGQSSVIAFIRARLAFARENQNG